MKTTESKIKGISFGVLLAGKVHDGSKTVTRRVVKSVFPDLDAKDWRFMGIGLHKDFPNQGEFRRGPEVGDNFVSQSMFIPCPYQVGQILYVREPWRVNSGWDWTKPSDLSGAVEVSYNSTDGAGTLGKYRQARFMPKRFARTFLMVTGVRCERLMEITEDDAVREGVECFESERGMRWKCYESDPKNHGFIDSTISFLSLWDSINGKDSHLHNPWVWVIEFAKVEMPNPWNEEAAFGWGWRKAMVGYVSDACSGLLLQVVPEMATGLVVGFINETNLGDYKTYPDAQLACQEAAMNHFLNISK